MKKLIALVLAVTVSIAHADFTPGQILKAQDLNDALAAKVGKTELPYVYLKAAPYNAKCDGSTDDYAAIMAAYNAAAAGSTILVPTGTCVVKTAPVFGTKRVSWKGMGARQSILQYAGTNTTSTQQ